MSGDAGGEVTRDVTGDVNGEVAGDVPATGHLDDVRVVTATEADAAAIRELPGLGQSTRRLIHLDLIRDDRCLLVARDLDDAVVGFAAGLVQPDDGHVLDLAVATERRGQGLGRRLLEELLTRMRARGVGGITLEVRRSNTVAIALYRRLGFVVEGARPGYYPDGEDALLMWQRDA